MPCLYCAETPSSEEHPLPAALGEFKDAPTLLDRICKQCNERRIGLLDEQFMRCGPAAPLRKRYGIEGREHHQKVNPFYRGSAGGKRVKFFSWDEAFQCEVLLEVIGGNEARQLTQLILKEQQSGQHHHIPMTSKMTAQALRHEISALKLTAPLDVRLIYDPPTEQWAVNLFQELWPDQPLPDTTVGARNFQGGIMQFETTDRYYRAFAKIGFHYFLTQFPEYSGHESIFSAIRDFIIDDAQGFQPARINEFVAKYQSPLMQPSTGWIGHLTCAEIREGVCFAHFEPFITPQGRMPGHMIRLGVDLARTDSAMRSHIHLYYAQGKVGRYSGDAVEMPEQVNLRDLEYVPAIRESLTQEKGGA